MIDIILFTCVAVPFIALTIYIAVLMLGVITGFVTIEEYDKSIDGLLLAPKRWVDRIDRANEHKEFEDEEVG